MVSGRKTTVENVTVDVDPIAVLSGIYSATVPPKMAFLSLSDNHWYVVSGYNYHKNEEQYEKDRPATEDEIQMKKSYETMYKFLKDNNL